MGIPESEEREKGTESLHKEITAENFPNLRKELIYKPIKLREKPIISMQTDLFQDTSY